jgi:hypothetical protein
LAERKGFAVEVVRLEALLAQILLVQMHGFSQALKASALRRAGFSNAEVAGLLGTTAGVVAQQLYELRSTGRKRSSKPSKASRKSSKSRKAQRATSKGPSKRNKR